MTLEVDGKPMAQSLQPIAGRPLRLHGPEHERHVRNDEPEETGCPWCAPFMHEGGTPEGWTLEVAAWNAYRGAYIMRSQERLT